jgi:hypothetical protein
LLRCLNNFARDQWRKERPHLSIEGEELELAEERDSARRLDAAFAWEVHRRVVEKLRAGKYAEAEMRRRFDQLRGFILGTDPDEGYSALAEGLGVTANNLRKFMHDLRDRYYDGFREEVAHLVPRDQIDEEMRYLVLLLAQHPPEDFQ